VLKAQEAGVPDLLDQLPGPLKVRSVGRSGSLAIRIFPRGDAWEREPLERFVRQLQAVDPEITGTPVLIYYYLEELRHAYNVSGRNALIVICVLLLVHFRSVKRASLALFPKLLGIIWMLGVMGTLGIDFNAANFMALPLTLGIGLIFGVHVLQQSDQARSLFQGSTGPAILLSALTTIIGFATLLAASHRGVASLGLVMAVGVGANLVTSVVVLPALLQAIRKR
jgi:predicted RND superfamily exporter protein